MVLGNGSKITDDYINSAAIWNANKCINFGINNNNSVIIDGVANQNDIAVFTTNGIKGR